MSKRKASSTQGFGAVKTEAELLAKFGTGNLPEGFQLKPHTNLTLDALRSFLKDFAAQLSTADWIVRVRSSHENARCLLVYDILKVFLLCGRGRRLHLEQASVAEIEESEKDSLHTAFEETPAVNQFVIPQGQSRGPIQLVVQIKKTLLPQTHTNKSTWQFFAELLAACRYNLNINQQKEAQVYGCLTDANTWYFYRAVQNETGWSIEAAEEVILFQSSATATNTTAAAINLFFCALLSNLTATSEDEVTTAQQQCDTLLSRRASKFTEEALVVMQLQQTLAQSNEGLAQRDRRIAELETQVQGQKEN